MKFDQFNESWPDWREGQTFADKPKLEQLRKEQKNLPTGRWLWAGIPIAIAIGRYSDWSSVEILGACAALGLFEVVDLLTRIIRQNHELRMEVEGLKGSIRENRWLVARNHEIAMKIGQRDELGESL